MAKKTVLTCKQGQTFTLPMELVGEDVTDYTGYKVRFMVKKNFDLDNSEAIIDETLTPDPTTGVCQLIVSDEETAEFVVGDYMYEGKLIDNNDNVLFTDTDAFEVIPALIKGATGEVVL